MRFYFCVFFKVVKLEEFFPRTKSMFLHGFQYLKNESKKKMKENIPKFIHFYENSFKLRIPNEITSIILNYSQTVHKMMAWRDSKAYGITWDSINPKMPPTCELMPPPPTAGHLQAFGHFGEPLSFSLFLFRRIKKRHSFVDG